MSDTREQLVAEFKKLSGWQRLYASDWLSAALARVERETWQEAHDIALVAVCDECKAGGFRCDGCCATARPSNAAVARKIAAAALRDGHDLDKPE